MKRFVAHVVRTECWHQEIEFEAETRGDARVIAERLAKEPGAWGLGDSSVHVESVERVELCVSEAVSIPRRVVPLEFAFASAGGKAQP